MDILIVEDLKSVREGLADALKKAGHNVFTSANSQEAETQLKLRKFDMTVIDDSLTNYQIDNVSEKTGSKMLVDAAKSQQGAGLDLEKFGKVMWISTTPLEIVLNDYSRIDLNKEEKERIISATIKAGVLHKNNDVTIPIPTDTERSNGNIGILGGDTSRDPGDIPHFEKAHKGGDKSGQIVDGFADYVVNLAAYVDKNISKER